MAKASRIPSTAFRRVCVVVIDGFRRNMIPKIALLLKAGTSYRSVNAEAHSGQISKVHIIDVTRSPVRIDVANFNTSPCATHRTFCDVLFTKLLNSSLWARSRKAPTTTWLSCFLLPIRLGVRNEAARRLGNLDAFYISAFRREPCGVMTSLGEDWPCPDHKPSGSG